MSARDAYVREEAAARGLFREIPIGELDPQKGDVVVGVCLRDISKASLHLGSDGTYEDKCATLKSAGLLPIGWEFVSGGDALRSGDMTWDRDLGPWAEVQSTLGMGAGFLRLAKYQPVIRKVRP